MVWETASLVHGAKDISDVDWSLRGRIRLLPISEKGELPPLTPWTPARLGAVAKPKKAESLSISSMGRWQEWKAAKEQKIKGRWVEEQRNRRHHWRGQAHDFKLKLIICMCRPRAVRLQCGHACVRMPSAASEVLAL